MVGWVALALVMGGWQVDNWHVDEAEIAIEAKQAQALADEAKMYAEAEALGVVAAVGDSGLAPSEQRSLAIVILREAKRNRIDPLLVVAVIRAESGFDSFAVSPVGAMGLMQLMPETGDYLLSKRGQPLDRWSNLFDYELNVTLGVEYLADLIRRFRSVENALIAYNAGPSVARRILAQPDARKRFMAGYPRKVVVEHSALRQKFQNEG